MISFVSKMLCAEDYHKTDHITTLYIEKFFNNLLGLLFIQPELSDQFADVLKIAPQPFFIICGAEVFGGQNQFIRDGEVLRILQGIFESIPEPGHPAKPA
jgi:hypothetical protein